ncbi:hypothetical protein E2562_018685 [Oryza meyeriana var. granulata]|uniref:Uncharacterized protein n=1 Tax=Oryza meyeriana var. granulata TaxID=110450 RepID=A0A6G1EMM7_9ORYZ|nr:hypothetical protein E2562_018685 [Oryza meyeriana var. granulata]
MWCCGLQIWWRGGRHHQIHYCHHSLSLPEHDWATAAAATVTEGRRVWARRSGGLLLRRQRPRALRHRRLRRRAPPTTLAEYTLGRPSGGDDFFDLSLIDGFNVPVSFQPTNGGAGCGKGRRPSCAVDITARCLPELQVPGDCASACGKFGGDTYCCRGQFEHNCSLTRYSMFFKWNRVG